MQAVLYRRRASAGAAMTAPHDKFDQRAIVQATFDRLHRLMDFSGIDGENVGIGALPLINRTHGGKAIWALPSTGCENTDIALGRECGLALLCALSYVVGDDELCDPDPAPIDLNVIHEALSTSPGSPDYFYALGFWGAIQGFIDLALNHPRLHAETLRRLRELAYRPEMIRERCKLVLAGYYPPEILAESAS